MVIICLSLTRLVTANLIKVTFCMQKKNNTHTMGKICWMLKIKHQITAKIKFKKGHIVFQKQKKNPASALKIISTYFSLKKYIKVG